MVKGFWDKMLGSEIYSDFEDDVNWIRDRVREDVKNLPQD